MLQFFSEEVEKIRASTRNRGIAMSDKIALLVTTKHKGVFFGYGQPGGQETIRLERARMCVYWSKDMRGVLGLASQGPSRTCRVGPEVPAITLRDVTAIVECTPVAEEQWRKSLWAE